MSISFKKFAGSLLRKAGINTSILDGRKYWYVTGASRVLELDYGHHKSMQTQRAVNQQGQPVPWFTYPAIDYLDQLDLSQKVMLEWGAGNSSLFFSPRVKQLKSVEHNAEWHDSVKSYAIRNHEIVLSDTADYAAAARRFDSQFDVILIDGIERFDCAQVAVKLLKDDGMLILDNSDRHPDIAEWLRENNLIQIDFHGFGPINRYTWTTSVFLTRQFSFQPLDRQPKIPVGGGF